MFFWAFHAVVFVAAEGREKGNEVVLSRPDIAAVGAYHRNGPSLDDTEVLIVKEFRTPGTAADGFVRELPGGSSWTPASPIEQARDELAEETDISVAAARLRLHQVRQPVATISSHREHVFAVELTIAEIAVARGDTASHGVPGDTERTYLEVHRYADLVREPLVDWTTLGAITSVLHTESVGQPPMVSLPCAVEVRPANCWVTSCR